MIEAIDYSARRGAVVHWLPKVFAVLQSDPGDDPAERNYVLWKKAINARLVDISTRWLFAQNERGAILGFMFYHFSADKKAAYIDELRVDSQYHQDEAVFAALIGKFQNEPDVKNAAVCYLGKRIKHLEREEILASSGWHDDDAYIDGYLETGSLKDTVNALNLRYLR